MGTDRLELLLKETQLIKPSMKVQEGCEPVETDIYSTPGVRKFIVSTYSLQLSKSFRDVCDTHQSFQTALCTRLPAKSKTAFQSAWLFLSSKQILSTSFICEK